VSGRLIRPVEVGLAAGAGVAAGAVAAQSLAAPAAGLLGLTVAVLGYALWLGLRLLARRGATGAGDGPEVPRGSAEGALVRRAEAAVERLREQTRAPHDAVLLEQLATVDGEATAVVADLNRYAGQAAAIEHSLRDIPVDRLRQRHAGMSAEAARLPAGPVRQEREHAVQALAEQLAVARRLAATRDALLARIESAVIDLEGLGTRVAELIVLHDTAADDALAADRLRELTDDVDSMRSGLAEARGLSDTALGIEPPPPAGTTAPIEQAAPVERAAPIEPAGTAAPVTVIEIDRPPAGKRDRDKWSRRNKLFAGVSAASILVCLGLCLGFHISNGGSSSAGGTAGANLHCARKIAYLGELSGPDSGDGETERDAVKLAVEEYDDAHTDCVQLVEFNTHSSGDDDAQDAVLGTEIAGDDSILGVVGPSYASDVAGALPPLQQAGVPVISPSASQTDLTAQGWNVFFRTVPSDNDQADAGVRFLHSVLHAGHPFVVSDDTIYGTSIGAEVQKRLGAARAGQAAVGSDQTDFTAVVGQVLASHADAVYFAGGGSDGGRFVAALRASSTRIQVVGGDRLMNTGFFDAAGTAATQGVFATCPCVPVLSGVEGFRSSYSARYGVDPGFYAPEAYDAATVLLSGIGDGHATRSGLLGWVANYDEDGITRHIRFDTHGDLSVPALHVWAYTLKGDDIYSDRVIP
jgi:branched-chain amino acid transport system substrate-binding protein